jgi:DNA processing protein
MAAPDRSAGARESVQLLALCTIEDVHWNVIAREARRPDGVARLLAGEVAEHSRTGERTRVQLAMGLADFDARISEAEHHIAAAEQVGARLVTILDEDYPSNLRTVPSPPPFLFYRGELRRDDARSVAVVGTRQPSSEGLLRAGKLAAALAEGGVTVISGLARGIDTAAHEAALRAGGRTIAVVGTGILSTYPKENVQLADRIAEEGALVSQFWPEAPPARFHFPLRNAVMSGISQGTAVVEASRTSGAKMQARIAREQGKRAFLMASLVTRERWAQDYIAERGAIRVESVEDVLRWLRSREQVERQSSQRDQLVLEPA